MKCDKCDNPAVVHEVMVRNGVKREIHLCAKHAQDAGIELPTNKYINGAKKQVAGRLFFQTRVMNGGGLPDTLPPTA